jgi:hypothetical protein
MNSYKRNGKKWTINETLSLEREFDLLNLSLQEIASRHKRTEKAILFKLESEGFIDCWDKVKGFDLQDYRNRMNGGDDYEDDYDSDAQDVEVNVENYHDYEEDDDKDADYVDDGEEDDDDSFCLEDKKDINENDISMLTERVWSLETSVSQITSMVKQLFDVMTEKKSSNKAKALRR